jgi:transcriptional regulator with XRE-family HTH domain
MEFGPWLAKRRNLAGLTQAQLATKTSLSPSYIARLELGTAEPPPRSTCRALARALGIDFDEIWGQSFAARLRRWLRREGYGSIQEPKLLDLLTQIQSSQRPPVT